MIGNPQHRQAANDAIPAQFDSEPMMFSVESLGDFVDVITAIPKPRKDAGTGTEKGPKICRK